MTPDPTQPALSELLRVARSQIVAARSTLIDARHKHGWADRIQHVEGLLTCGVSTLYNSIKEIEEFEVRLLDEERGPHIKIGVRGIGLDNCPGCFVCGTEERSEGSNNYLNNIAGFVDSSEDGEKLVQWFGGRARLDIRKHEPNYRQVKIGACDAHLPNLRKLCEAASRYNVIRQKDIEEAKS